MPRLKLPTLWDYWVNKLSAGTFEYEEMESHIDRLRDEIQKASADGKCYWELVPVNCFYNEQKDELLFFDQEYYWENTSPDVALCRALWSINYSPAFSTEPRSQDWLDKIKLRYKIRDNWLELSKLADIKALEVVFGNGDDKLKTTTLKSAVIIDKNKSNAKKKKHKTPKDMQGKVSMVVTCFNKVKYISAMLDSVLEQVWDNIEVILVNDGSTDGTREIIAENELFMNINMFQYVKAVKFMEFS